MGNKALVCASFRRAWCQLCGLGNRAQLSLPFLSSLFNLMFPERQWNPSKPPPLLAIGSPSTCAWMWGSFKADHEETYLNGIKLTAGPPRLLQTPSPAWPLLPHGLLPDSVGSTIKIFCSSHASGPSLAFAISLTSIMNLLCLAHFYTSNVQIVPSHNSHSENTCGYLNGEQEVKEPLSTASSAFFTGVHSKSRGDPRGQHQTCFLPPAQERSRHHLSCSFLESSQSKDF